ncbi:hypothetical protein FLM55_04285 [Francisella sp. Scap27]|uniref:TackOD1 domain-containing metal-binding protein n=1 Tax=Francisella sp. Scap27 TaxID=2589986 RepID=UPI0015BC2363|nr:hypothetical protein [Francisella sp. Scap27]QLE78993.1 hypothetical protein FLM55_04285 [Francisella sp. Scap27]
MSFNIGVFGSFDFKGASELKNEITSTGSKIYEFNLKEDVVSQIQTNNIQVLILNLQKKDLLIDIVNKIRSSAEIYLLPVFSVVENYEIYVDALYSSVEELNSVCEKLTIKKETLVDIDSKRMIKDWQTRFLTYLYTRKGLKSLDASVDKASKSFYSFPLIEVFHTDNTNVAEWIGDLKSDEFLKIKKFVKSYFCCQKCDSARILYSEQCPDCKSENILLTDFIHCYTCGNMGPQSEFLHNEQYVCTHCNTKLKHIGQDYDKPLENYYCKSCNFSFLEPNVISECIDCDNMCDTEQLKKMSVHNYELTQKAEHFISVGLNYAMSVFDNINYIVPEFFYNFIEWSSLMQKRDESYAFSLLRINISDNVSVDEIVLVSKSLKAVLRKTDMLTRINGQTVWIWLPNTPIDGAMVVLEKLNTIRVSEGANAEDMTNIKAFSSENLGVVHDAKILLIELANKD